MTASYLIPSPGPCLRRRTSPHKFVGPGEAEFASWCQLLGIDISYEPFLYELVTILDYDDNGVGRVRVRKGFAPDFLIHATDYWPAMHVEITGARRRGKKIYRMRRTREQYRMHTVLLVIGTSSWRRIEREPQELRRLLLRAGRRAIAISPNSSAAESA